ncbi:MAG: tyrosine-protein phosphatase [Candidatus Zhuqueibacterota bacterium]
MSPKLIDIHSHILPFIDDGSENWESSLSMLQNGEKEGIVAIVATPHVLSQTDFKSEQKIIDAYLELQRRAVQAGLKIKIYLGCEIYAQHDTSLNYQIATLNNNKKYFLMEFPMSSIPRFVPEMFFKFIVNEKIPIVAHPERNLGFQMKPMLVYDYVQRGALMQINEGSLRGKYGQHAQMLAVKMIENNLAHFIASDGHKPDGRTVTLLQSYEAVAKNFGKDKAELLFCLNPKKAINGEPIINDNPLPIESELKPKFWQKFKWFKKSI